MKVEHLDIFPHYGRQKTEASKLKRFLFEIVPQHTLRPFVSELRCWIVRLRTRNVHCQFLGSRNVLVNVGAGENGHSGWINIDIAPRPGINCVSDCRKRLPLPNSSARAIYSEHFFEHLDYTEEIPYFLAECHRVLAPGAILRLVVPDAEAYLRAYCEGSWDKLAQLRTLKGRRDHWIGSTYNTRMELINAVFRQGAEHKFAYDYETLEFVLNHAGFRSIHRRQFGESALPDLHIDDPKRASESLYVEAAK